MSKNFVKYDLESIIEGNTFNGVSFTISVGGVPVDLLGASVKIEFRKCSPSGEIGQTLSNGSGMTISDSTIFIDQFIPTLTAGTWFWDLKITFSDGVVKTWFGGTFQINTRVTV